MACLLPLWAQEHSNKPTHGQFKKTAKFPFFYQSREIVRRNTISNSNIFQWIENVIDGLEEDRSSRRLWRRLPGRLVKNRFARGFKFFVNTDPKLTRPHLKMWARPVYIVGFWYLGMLLSGIRGRYSNTLWGLAMSSWWQDRSIRVRASVSVQKSFPVKNASGKRTFRLSKYLFVRKVNFPKQFWNFGILKTILV